MLEDELSIVLLGEYCKAKPNLTMLSRQYLLTYLGSVIFLLLQSIMYFNATIVIISLIILFLYEVYYQGWKHELKLAEYAQHWDAMNSMKE